MTMINSLIRFSRRQLHTIIISKEIIKPSSSTPCHLKTYNLSLYDQACENAFMPMVLFYPNTNGSIHHDMPFHIKKSLSQTLTKYYPFAGRHAKIAPAHVDFNDDGAEFLEASVDTTLSDFFQNSHHEDLDQFFPYNQVWSKSNRKRQTNNQVVIPLAVQLNHFKCGGVALAASLSHKIADGNSFAYFLTDWAKITRFCFKKQNHDQFPDDDNPHFISFPNVNMNTHGFSVDRSNNCVTRSFIFPNAKINDLKLKVKSMMTQEPITNLTRVEVLNWLLYKCAIKAAIKNKCFKWPSGVSHPINIRTKMMEPLPEKTIGNFSMIMRIVTKNENEMQPESFINELKEQKAHFKSLKNIETAFGIGPNNKYTDIAIQELQRKVEGAYICTSMCGYPIYDIDFGWGKPVKASVGGKAGINSFFLMDTLNKDGIEAMVCLSKQDMAIFQTDPELLLFC